MCESQRSRFVLRFLSSPLDGSDVKSPATSHCDIISSKVNISSSLLDHDQWSTLWSRCRLITSLTSPGPQSRRTAWASLRAAWWRLTESTSRIWSPFLTRRHESQGMLIEVSVEKTISEEEAVKKIVNVFHWNFHLFFHLSRPSIFATEPRAKLWM